MEFIDLGRQLERIRADVSARMEKVLNHGQFIMGPEVAELERQLAEFVGVKHCVTCGNGTDALQMALMAAGVGPGDAVFTTTFTFIATAEVITLLGATPVFVDIDERTFNIDPAQLQLAVEKTRAEGRLRPKAVIPVDLFGLPADYTVLEEFCRREGLFLLEDAAQSLGSSLHGRMAGSFGDCGSTSFFPAKPLGCYGDGGALFTNDDQLASKLRSIRIHGKGTDKYDNVRLGVNSRLDTLQAAVLLAKLAIFRDEIRARQEVASGYSKRLAQAFKVPYVPEGAVSAWAQYSIVVDNRADLQASLKAAGIPTNVYYPKPLHQQTAYQSLGYQSGSFPVSERIAETILSLPMHPYLEQSQIELVAEACLQSKTATPRV
ncbi:DegT/DnrJ/EryC1/StrS family aminotransferase [bacterium]|nr:DegT/DnrJ/EryC1/StrS family aminotransferase [bacterium]